MPKGKKRKTKSEIRKELQDLLYISFAVLVILLSILNLQKTDHKSRHVLGVSTEIENFQLIKEKYFWEEFLAKNPTYYDGWKRISEIEFFMGDYKSAIDSYEVAKRIDFNH